MSTSTAKDDGDDGHGAPVAGAAPLSARLVRNAELRSRHSGGAAWAAGVAVALAGYFVIVVHQHAPFTGTRCSLADFVSHPLARHGWSNRSPVGSRHCTRR